MSGEPVRRIVAREAALFLLALVLAALASWPLVLHLGPLERMADRTLDDHVYWWDFWWAREALLVRGVDPWFCPEIFVPHGASLVASPFALPLGVLSLPFQAIWGPLPGAVVAVKLFGLLFLALGVWGMSLFARSLGVPLWASVLAGMLFSFTPFRMVQLGRIHYLAGALVPLFLHAALHVVRDGGWRWVATGAALFAVALATDPSLGLELVLATGALLLFAWRHGEPFLRTTARLLGCGLAGALLASPLLVRFVAEARANPGLDVASRLVYDDDPNLVQRLLSPDLDGLAWFTAPALHEALLMAPEEWDYPAPRRSAARLNADLYEKFRPVATPAVQHAAATVGALVALLGAWAVARALGRRGGGAFVLLALVGLLLALGPQRTFFGHVVEMPYAWLARVVPGMAAGRYPTAHLRLFELGLALAAALGATGGGRGLQLGLRISAAIAALGYLAVAPLRPFRFEPRVVEEIHERMAADPVAGAVLELPPRTEIMLRRMALGQVVHRRPLLAGPLTRVPPTSWDFFDAEPFVPRCMRPLDPARIAPEQLAVEVAENRALLARYGVRYIVLRRFLFEHDPDASRQLVAYLAAHGFTLTGTRDGHVLARIDAE